MQRASQLPLKLFALALATAAAGASAGCEEAGSSAVVGIVNAWGTAGLEPQGFAPLQKPIEGIDRKAECHQGKVKGLEVTLCKLAGAAEARAARPAGLAVVGEVTGLALDSGQFLLIVADRDKVDPSGKAINQLVKTFRETAAPSPQQPSEGDKTVPADDKKAGDEAAKQPAAGQEDKKPSKSDRKGS